MTSDVKINVTENRDGKENRYSYTAKHPHHKRDIWDVVSYLFIFGVLAGIFGAGIVVGWFVRV